MGRAKLRDWPKTGIFASVGDPVGYFRFLNSGDIPHFFGLDIRGDLRGLGWRRLLLAISRRCAYLRLIPTL